MSWIKKEEDFNQGKAELLVLVKVAEEAFCGGNCG
jgi:hypothetical protein